MDFSEIKSRILQKYQEAIELGLVDEKMLEINSAINSMDSYVTTSTCAGRSLLISKNGLRSKYQTEFHLKTHNPEEISSFDPYNIQFRGELWFLIEAPNLHIRCLNLENAVAMQQLGLQAKLGKSKIQSIQPATVVEILGTGSLQVPIGRNGKLMIDTDYWRYLIEHGIELLMVEQDRLTKFYELIKKGHLQ